MASRQPLKKYRKRESGTQLLARLNSRTDLSSLEPDLFDKVPSFLTSSPRGQIIEVYGMEGTGKTEIILHYIARACLPAHWNGLSLNGLGSKVIFIDTEFKFSVFRLAIVMEKHILAHQEKARPKCDGDELSALCNANSSSVNVTSLHNEETSSSQKLNIVENKSCPHTEDSHTQSGPRNLPGSDFVPNVSGVGESMPVKRVDSLYSKPGHHENGALEQSRTVVQLELTPQNVEDIVQDSLGRVQVLNVLNTEQLLFSLLSLESNLSSDPLVSIIAIDTISAFYWTDKLGDLENYNVTDTKMCPIANIISKFVSEFGVTFLVTKSALIGDKRVRSGDKEGGWSGGVLNSSDVQGFSDGQGLSDVTARNEKSYGGHVEFLGKSWSGLGKKRIVLSRTVDGRGREVRAARSSDWPACKLFTCTDDGFAFV